MNLVLLETKELSAPDQVRLTDRRHDHIRRVLKAEPGDRVCCGMVDGNMGTGTIRHMTEKETILTVTLDRTPPAPLPVILVLALPRPKALRRIIQNVTSMGVKEIHLVNAWRVEKSFWQSPFLSTENLRFYCTLGLEQARDTRMPSLHLHRFFTRFVREHLSKIAVGTRLIVAHPSADKRCPAGVNQPVTLAVGPEGGWIDIELSTFAEAGFSFGHLSSRVLTVETAVISLISRLFT